MSDITDARATMAERRRKGFVLFGGAILLAALVFGAWWLFSGRYSETTDDAYVAGNIVAVTSRENATVTALYADNTQSVHQGQLLIEMDPSIAEVTMRAAEANLARDQANSDLAYTELVRSRKLLARLAVPRSEFEAFLANKLEEGILNQPPRPFHPGIAGARRQLDTDHPELPHFPGSVRGESD